MTASDIRELLEAEFPGLPPFTLIVTDTLYEVRFAKPLTQKTRTDVSWFLREEIDPELTLRIVCPASEVPA